MVSALFRVRVQGRQMRTSSFSFIFDIPIDEGIVTDFRQAWVEFVNSGVARQPHQRSLPSAKLLHYE
jgi:hypothetical protein